MYLQVLAVPTPRGAGRGSLKQQQLSENYYTEHSEEHDEYEEAEVGALLGAGRRRARPPPHRDSLDSRASARPGAHYVSAAPHSVTGANPLFTITRRRPPSSRATLCHTAVPLAPTH